MEQVKSLNRYTHPRTGQVLVDIGDILTKEVVDLLGRSRAVRVRLEDYDSTMWDKLDHAMAPATRLPCGCTPGRYMCPTASTLWSSLTGAWAAMWGESPTGTWQQYDQARDAYRAHYPMHVLG